MKAGTLLYSRTDGTTVELVSIQSGTHTHVLTGPAAILLALDLLKNGTACMKLGELSTYIEARKAE